MKTKTSQIKTKVVKGMEGHAVEFTIDNQTFTLKEVFGGNGREMNSKEHAEWYEKQLRAAFNKLEH